ncbi:MAG TPA: TetR/AcrR family transcriptional regulator [Anaerolineae bacterium]|nr:TetR/AcrR family transcriptional regulator [Anaerolineae bacterium]
MPRPDVSEERRTQIIEAAMRVFARSGFQEARMDDIVAETGLSKGALYWYYKSKDEIIQSIMDSMFDRELAGLEALQEDDRPAGERLLEFTRVATGDLKRYSKLLPLFYEFYALAFRNKTVRKALTRYLRQYFAMIEPLIQQGIDRGEFRPVDAKQAAIAVGSLFEGTLLLWVYDPDTVKFDKHVEIGTQLLLDGLRAHSG